jgi:hypothetical protein
MECPLRVIVVEGALEVPAALKLLECLDMDENAPPPIDKRGRDAFWADIHRYNQAAEWGPVFALADLEREPCASAVFQAHLPAGRHPNLVLRLAVGMLESWLMADGQSLARFLKVSQAVIPRDPDREPHGKLALVNIARRSRLRHIRDDLVPEPGVSAMVGKNYTARMSQFIRDHWRPLEAQTRSPSLQRAITALRRLTTP